MLADRIKHYRSDAEEFDYFNVESPVNADEERRRMQFLKRKIKFPPDSLIIDCGSGNGWIAREYLARDIAVVSVDFSDRNLRQIQEKYDPQRKGFYVVADLNNLPFKNSIFDGATSNDVYEHIEEPDKAAVEICRCLKQKSRFYVSVPYKENLIYYLCIHCNKPTPANAHLHSFDEDSLGNIFQSAGFKVEKYYKFINKALQVTFFYYVFCRWMPFRMWRTIDIAANLIVNRQSRIALKMVRN